MIETDVDLANAYTDSPQLHPNLILGSLQLFIWLFFHSSAWRNHLLRVDPNLHPNFDLGSLNRSQWRNLALRQLLLRGFIILPLCSGLLAGFILLILGRSAGNILIGIGVAIGLGFGAGSSGLIVSIPVSMAMAAWIGLSGGLAVGLGIDPASNLGSDFVEAKTFAFGLTWGVIGSMAGHVAGSVTGREQSYPPLRQLRAAVSGGFVGSIILYVAGLLMINQVINLLIIGLVAGVLAGLTIAWYRRPVVGLIVGLATIAAFGLTATFLDEVAFLIVLFAALATLPYLLAESIGGAWAGIIASVVGGGSGLVAVFILGTGVPFWPPFVLFIVCVISGITMHLWGAVFAYPFLMGWNAWLRRTDEHRRPDQPARLRRHPAFWDEHQRLPWLGLDEHLLLIIERNPIEGQIALDYLSIGRQRWAARAAQIELDARLLAGCTSVHSIAQAHRNSEAGELIGPASALLRSFNRISRDVDAALAQASAYNQRLALSAIEDRLDSLLRELTRSNERYAVRFRPIVTAWRQIIAAHVRQLAETVELHQEIDNPYVIGVPLTERQEIFVGRTAISARIEQLLLDRRRPPLLLYGQRRMGKTSLLNNLGRLLPSTIVPLFIDLQGPASHASDHAGFFYNIARGMISSARRQRDLTLPPLTRETLTPDPFTFFDEWLDDVERALGEQTAFVTLDEFEALDRAIVKGNLDGKALLNMMRHLIQHRPRFKILLTSSQSLDEFQRWASSLINIQVVPISYLSQAETSRLIEQPVKDFALVYEPLASQRVLALTRGHPFLAQLLCGEIVALKNEQDHAVRRLARLADVEAAVPEALNRGSFFFADIERNQIDANGRSLLRFLAGQGEGIFVDQETLRCQLMHPDELEPALAQLIRRELIEAVDNRYRFQVELIRRWFAKYVV